MPTDTQKSIEGEGFSALALLSKLNRRIQLLHYEASDPSAMVAVLEKEARKHGFDKVFLKAPLYDRPALEGAGLEAEATILGYFAGQPAVVMSLFLSHGRRERPFAREQELILSRIREEQPDPSLPPLPHRYVMHPATRDDAPELARFYARVFDSYPFPITDPAYVASSMEEQVAYRIVRDETGALVAAASAETSTSLGNAEMTDFATLPAQRGQGLAQNLLAALEEDMAARGITNLYTIARTLSVGMNRVFHNRGYDWTGTLVNNCHIAGKLEDMHVWCRNGRR
jgi:putative beta-lysine N-acetyltransferase